MKHPKFTLIITFCILFFQAIGQESLQEKYDELLEKTETFEQYKVIPRTRLNSFWSEAVDSLNRGKEVITELRSELDAQKQSVVALNIQVNELQTQLDSSLDLNDTINFIGIPFSKLGYHLMVWAIIVTLAVLGIISYFMFLRSNTVTSKVKKEHEILLAEFEDHKTKAREKQVKLKRDLQTAVNQLSERR
ncbi:hypothetical protein [Ekhidna sp.]